MEFIFQLLSQLFSEPERDTKKVAGEEIKAAEIKNVDKELVKNEGSQEQPEPNLFNILDFH